MMLDVLSSHRVEELKRETLADPLCRRLTEVVSAGSSRNLLASGTSVMSPAVHCTLSPMGLLRGLCTRQSTCWRSVHKMERT